MRTIILSAIATLLACLGLTATQVYGHGSAHSRISAMSQEIREDPLEAELYVERGHLHRIHELWDEALSDYDRAAELEPLTPGLHLYRGRALMGADRYEEALEELELHLASNLSDATAYLDQARVLYHLARYTDAEEAFSSAIRFMDAPSPDCFLERANAVAAHGTKHVSRAIAGLNEGIDRCGPAASLVLRAVELHEQIGQYDQALTRLEIILAHAGRKEQLLNRKGELLTKAGRHNEATLAYREALDRISKLSDHKKRAPATQALEHALRQRMGAPQ